MNINGLQMCPLDYYYSFTEMFQVWKVFLTCEPNGVDSHRKTKTFLQQQKKNYLKKKKGVASGWF